MNSTPQRRHTQTYCDVDSHLTHISLRPWIATLRAPINLSLIPLLQIPLLHKPARKPLNLQSRKHSVQVPLREIIPSFSRGYEHLQLDTTRSIALHRSGGEFRAETVDVVLDERLESLPC